MTDKQEQSNDKPSEVDDVEEEEDWGEGDWNDNEAEVEEEFDDSTDKKNEDEVKKKKELKDIFKQIGVFKTKIKQIVDEKGTQTFIDELRTYCHGVEKIAGNVPLIISELETIVKTLEAKKREFREREMRQKSLEKERHMQQMFRAYNAEMVRRFGSNGPQYKYNNEDWEGDFL
jgi:hypothetical protein